MRKFLLVAVCLVPVLSHAHESSTVELALDVDARQFDVDMDLLDAEFVVGFKRAYSGTLTVADVQHSAKAIYAHVQHNVGIRGCALRSDGGEIGVRPGARPRIRLGFALQCPEMPGRLELHSKLFGELPDYRTVLSVTSGSGSRLYVVDGENTQVNVDMKSGWSSFSTFVVAGVRHILSGFDHLLFLLLLALPMLRRTNLRSCFVAVAGVVTAFTVAHSITLSLSALGYMSLSPRPVEILIAVSIVVVAALNVLGKGDKLAWPLAYMFGLVHGFGFAGAFAELASGASIRWTNLLGFNIGVEAGQIAVIASVLLLMSLLTRLQEIGRFLVPAGSIAAGLIGIGWIIERV